MKKQTTKRALLLSALSLLLCVSMLIGSTFAWFTDSVTSGKNQIVAGNLDVTLKYWNGTEYAEVTSDTKLFNDAALWEPGHTEVAYLEVGNAGSLALKYQLGVNVYNETAGETESGAEIKLSEYLVFSVVADKQITTTDDLYTRESAIAAAGDTRGLKEYNSATTPLTTGEKHYVALIIYMPETVGNEANYRGDNVPSITMGTTLYATQYTLEEDSFNKNYDEGAWHEGFKVYSAQDLQAAIDAGETEITLMEDVTLDKGLVIPAPKMRAATAVRINLNGKNIVIEAAYNDADATASSAVVNNGNLILTGNGTIKATNNYTVRNYGAMVIDGITVENGIMNFAALTVESGNISNSRSGKHTIYNNNAELTINGGTFYNGNPGNAAIFAYGGEVALNGGEYTIADGTATLGWTSCLIDAQGNAKYTISGGDYAGTLRDYNNNMEITGGTFTYNPSNEFVADGFEVEAKDDGTFLVKSGPVAQVGTAKYYTIEEAVANWTNGSTLTLLKDVTLSDTIVLKSTEHHKLNLSTCTMTAASGKNAIEITCNGLSNATYALTIDADATNPGGITASGKACIYYKKADNSIKDRPIILINNGVFTGSYSLNITSNGNTNCPQIWINGGIFNSYMNLTKCMMRVSGGTFHAAINCTGDSSAYREIKGGRFKSWQFMTADAPTKFWVGSGNGNYNVGVYVDKEGYLVVGGPVITEAGEQFAAKATNATKWSSYLKYSSAATYGLYYEDADMAIAKHGEANVTVYAD